MMNLLVLKEKIRILYQKAELYIDPLAKFLVAMVVFLVINQQFGYNPKLNSLPVVLLLSLLCAFTPSAVLVLLAAVAFIGHVYAVSKILSILVILILFVLYFLFARFTPKQGYIILALPILFFLKVPYLVPIALGVASTPIAIIPVSCGVVVYYMLEVIQSAAELNTNTSVEDTLTLYKFVIDSLLQNKIMIFTLVMFAIVLIITYLIRKINMDHAFDIAIVAGGVVTILGFLIGDLGLDVSDNVGIMILGTLISMVLAYIIQFFRLTLDYTGVERVQFEDDDYYYYVKAVPKINVTAPEKNVKRINPQKSSGSQGRESDTEIEIDYDEFEPFDATKDSSN